MDAWTTRAKRGDEGRGCGRGCGDDECCRGCAEIRGDEGAAGAFVLTLNPRREREARRSVLERRARRVGKTANGTTGLTSDDDANVGTMVGTTERTQGWRNDAGDLRRGVPKLAEVDCSIRARYGDHRNKGDVAL